MQQSVYWLGGSPCAGKSSIARVLADRYDVHLLHVDDGLGAHIPHLTATDQPTLYKWTHTPWDALWMQPADALLAEAISAYTEHCALVLQDIAALPVGGRVLVEGTCLLPACIAPHLATPNHGLWLTPTEAFQHHHYRARGAWVQAVLDQCHDPDAAWARWMARDAAFARWVAQAAAQQHLTLWTVDGSRSIADLATHVATHFGWES